jgi:hypothetical protein
MSTGGAACPRSSFWNEDCGCDALYFRAGPPQKGSAAHQAKVEVSTPDAPATVVGVPQCGLTARPLGLSGPQILDTPIECAEHPWVLAHHPVRAGCSGGHPSG